MSPLDGDQFIELPMKIRNNNSIPVIILDDDENISSFKNTILIRIISIKIPFNQKN